MDKNLTWKIVLIIALIIIAVWTLYPPSKTLKPGIDLGGGTSLIYEIDAKGLSSDEKRGLSERVITVLRRRIDPANIQNLVWRPQGSTRFEIQMPLASAEAREKRTQYETALTGLLTGNVTQTAIIRSVAKPAEMRAKDFEKFARDSNDRAQILNDFAKVFDERKALQQQRDDFANQMATPEGLIKLAGLKLDDIKIQVIEWAKLKDDKRKQAILDYLGSEGNLDLLTRYTEIYAKWAGVADRLTEPKTGVNSRYEEAKQTLHKLNLSNDQVTSALEAGSPGSAKNKRAVEILKKEFPELADKIDKVAKAYNTYFPFRGRLDDPSDLQRMLKGAGILEFRILPTLEHPEVDSAQMNAYVETLKTKGPKYPLDDQYVWLEIENPAAWLAADRSGRKSITAQFGDKAYVLASNRKNKDETMLHAGQRDWKLVKSSPGQDQQGRRAIDFELDERGGKIFSNVTGKNIDRPLCIVLDNVALSAPNIQARIYTNGQITGGFKQTVVEDMVTKLNAGSLPARLIEQPVSVKTIGPSIGADNLQKGLKSGMVGLVCVILFMLVYYRKGGVIADIALLLNILFLLAIMAGISATFTLPGIAGVILTIGMAVDTNILIFERIREEQEKGASIGIAVKLGYERAFRAIFDSHVTTILTALILYWVASEEIKGFALTLMLGLASNLFTAFFVTRMSFDWLLKHKIVKDHMVFLHLIKKPNIDWMKALPVFLVISAILTIGGVTLFFMRDDSKNNKYDIEFTGGTSAQIDLVEGVKFDRQQVEDRIHKEGEKLNNKALAAATVYSVGDTGRQYEITTTETNKTKAVVAFSTGQWTVESVTAAVKKAADAQQAEMPHLIVTPEKSGQAFAVGTSQLNKNTVADVLKLAFPDANISDPQFDEIVSNAILAAFGEQLEIRKNLQPKVVSAEKITESMLEYSPDLLDFVGGVAVRCELGTSATPSEISQRFEDLKYKPDMRGVNWYAYRVLDSNLKKMDPNMPVKSFVYIASEPEIAAGQQDSDVWIQFVDGEKAKVVDAMQIASSLPHVTQISPSIGAEAKTAALIAAILSLIAMMIYLGLRFGDVRYGLGGVVTLAHDTTATMGALMCCAFIAATAWGPKLLIADFKIDMTMVGAFLTLLGYSINDTIIIYDRIRENRKKGILTPQLINDSINATLSRTILTSTTVFLVVFVMYVFGGNGLRGFNYAMLFGVIEGTYSSIAISAPILLIRAQQRAANKPAPKQQQN
ncbi:MAG: protein translocase subunit SecD [Sedimentisphaerales bacterium]|jgi:SecD/SecF fusion protein